MSAVPSSLSARIIAFEALQDFIPLYPLYQLLFTDHGLSAAEVSTLFIIWSTTSFLLEVPSGAWADVFSRRKLLMLGAFLSGLGYAAWIVLPSFAGFALGFVLWGTSSALISGTFEAFAYDELAARGSTSKYAGLLGKARAAALVMNLAATLLAAPLYQLGGYVLAGVVSVSSCLLQVVVAMSLPEAAQVATADETEEVEPGTGRGALGRYRLMLRSGLTEVASNRTVRKAVALVALLGGFLAFDEYFPLLAREVGASTVLVPLLIAGTVAAQAIGGALAGPAYTLRASYFAVGLGLTAALIAWGSLSGTAAGFVPIAVGYGVMQLVIVVAEARLQDSIEGPARATVTSVSGFFAEVFAVTVYAGFALGSVWFTLPILMAALTVPVVLTAAITPSALPAPANREEQPSESEEPAH
ncbi:MFS transporter [Kribbella sp. VKM Ac-2527]|uniref:MFS transporter n=1 Tax=Kribbella caucasensis TaxID=2512215 RepID=A0A4R6KRB3_9ACTN|nr:MFS transporter [Kribbella sp. VKM Ac-2527]TDO54714.1 MFS transporter [Kribbella sp. VKM Ac-2527]